MANPAVVGFYGKLPSHGDFLRRRVSDSFVSAWDGWLQACLEATRGQLEGRWLEVYLTSPVWRFACAAGVFGEMPALGLMVPSVDRVGRYFHLALVAEIDPMLNVATAAMNATDFFDAAESLVLETLDADPLDFEAFDARVAELGEPLAAALSRASSVLDPEASTLLIRRDATAWQFPIGSSRLLGPTLGQLMAQHLVATYEPLTLWWTDGSPIVEPSGLILSGLPTASAFGSLLDGLWAERQWRAVPCTSVASASADDAAEPSPPRFRSAAATDVGRVRTVNQDAFLERSEVGVWAVADGLGGHSGGEVASRMVCDALADFEPHAGFEEMVAAAGQRVQDVNQALIRASGQCGRCGSTVVALLARGSRCVVLWAGDSRVYRWRAGELSQLTQDHSAPAEAGTASTAVTRAVGGDDVLTLDRHTDRVHVGDRFLLCSDGLTRAVPDEQILSILACPDIRVAVDGLVEATLKAGAPDNVTALVVEAIQ